MVQDLGTADIDARLEELLIDGILYAFQEQVHAIVTVVVCEGSESLCVGACCYWPRGACDMDCMPCFCQDAWQIAWTCYT